MASYSVSTLDGEKFEGSGGTPTLFTYTITRDGDLSAAGSVDWRMVVGLPAPFNLNDLLRDPNTGKPPPTTGTAVFAAGQATVTLTFRINPDTDVEPNEGFGVQLRRPSSGDTIGTDRAFSVIKDDDGLHALGTTQADKLDHGKSTKGTVTDVSQGGDDKVIGSPFDDTVFYGAAFSATDRFEGGAGHDRIVLAGDYSAGITLVSTTLRSVEEIDLTGDFNYKLTIGNAAVAAGEKLVIDIALSSLYNSNINASAEADGHLHFDGGAGIDILTGGKLADYFRGDYGADQLNGGNGADIFAYGEDLDSPLLADFSGQIVTSVTDVLLQFQTSQDKIDLSAFSFLGEETAVLTKNLNSFSFDLNSGTGFFGTAGVATEYAKVGKAVQARVYVDVNKDGNLGAGDMLIQVTGVAKGSITTGNFIF